jgi:hypothetical protein
MLKKLKKALWLSLGALLAIQSAGCYVGVDRRYHPWWHHEHHEEGIDVHVHGP